MQNNPVFAESSTGQACSGKDDQLTEKPGDGESCPGHQQNADYENFYRTKDLVSSVSKWQECKGHKKKLQTRKDVRSTSATHSVEALGFDFEQTN